MPSAPHATSQARPTLAASLVLGLLILLGVLIPVLMLPGAASASSEVANTEAMTRSEVQRWSGRWCPTTGCPAPSPARPADIAAFGCAIFGIAWLARRQAPESS